MAERRHDGGDDAPIRVLVAEDDAEMRELVRRVLVEEGYAVLEARDGHEAMAFLGGGAFDILLTDIRMPGPDGLEVLRRAMASHLRAPVILMTAFGSIGAAVEAMREGAYHYLAKPFDLDDLLGVIATAAEQIRQLRDVTTARSEGSDPFFPIVFRSRAMRELLAMAGEVAESSATVLIQGGSGTGKELLARAIHAMSRRRRQAFVAVDCHAIPEGLLESELFGHARGAFTGAVSDQRGIIDRAEGGTLFLDEVGNLTAPVQAKLLRFLQERRFRRVGESEERSVDVRVVSATNRDLAALLGQGAFREDLFYRLSVIPLRIPDLAERREDIAPLVYHFIRTFNASNTYQVEGIRQDALELLLACPWPGNVRQLENVLERAVILRKAGLIQPRDLPEEIVAARGTPPRAAGSLDDMERGYIRSLLEQHDGNQTKVARILGINRRTLYRKLKRYEDEP